MTAEPSNPSMHSADPLVEAEFLDPDRAQTVIDPSSFGTVDAIIDIAKRRVDDAAPGTTTDQLNEQFKTAMAFELTPEQQLARDDYFARLAQEGYTPPGTIEELVKFHELFVMAYKNSQRLPKQELIRRSKLVRKFELLEATYQEFISTGKQEAQQKDTEATRALERQKLGLETDRIRADQARGNAYVDVEAAKHEGEQRLDTVATNTQTNKLQNKQRLESAEILDVETQVVNTRRIGVADNDRKVLPRAIDNDLLQKQIASRKETTQIIWNQVLRPFLKPAWKIALIVTVLAVTFSYFIERSGTPMYPLIAPFNDLRHLLLDPFWNTLVATVPELGPTPPA